MSATEIRRGLVIGFSDHSSCSCSSCEQTRARIAALEALVAERDRLAAEYQTAVWAASTNRDRRRAAEARADRLQALIVEFESLPVRRHTDGTTVMERGPLDNWRVSCAAALAASSGGEAT